MKEGEKKKYFVNCRVYLQGEKVVCLHLKEVILVKSRRQACLIQCRIAELEYRHRKGRDDAVERGASVTCRAQTESVDKNERECISYPGLRSACHWETRDRLYSNLLPLLLAHSSLAVCRCA